MPEQKSIMDIFNFPKDWNIIGTGRNRYQVGLETNYIVIDTKLDVITALIYSGKIDIRQISEMASWSFVRKVKINGHDGYIHIHPEGFRRLLTWQCPSSDKTFQVHFSLELPELVQAFRKSKCH